MLCPWMTVQYMNNTFLTGFLTRTWITPWSPVQMEAESLQPPLGGCATYSTYKAHAVLPAVMTPAVVDQMCACFAGTGSVTRWCVMKGPSHYLPGSTQDLTVTQVAVWPEVLGLPVPGSHLEISHCLTGGDGCLWSWWDSYIFSSPFIITHGYFWSQSPSSPLRFSYTPFSLPWFDDSPSWLI